MSLYLLRVQLIVVIQFIRTFSFGNCKKKIIKHTSKPEKKNGILTICLHKSSTVIIRDKDSNKFINIPTYKYKSGFKIKIPVYSTNPLHQKLGKVT